MTVNMAAAYFSILQCVCVYVCSTLPLHTRLQWCYLFNDVLISEEFSRLNSIMVFIGVGRS